MSAKNQIYKFLSDDGHVRASAILCEDLLNEVRENQKTTPPSTLALGRSLIGTCLMSSHLKDGQALSTQFICDGPMNMLFAQSSYEGECRAYISEPKLPLSLEAGKLHLAPHVGSGTLTVSNYMSPKTPPQRSQVEIQTGEITEDFAHYILQSMQIPCMLTSGLNFASDESIASAGGLLVELMPGHTEEDIRRVESCFRALGPLSVLLPTLSSGKQLLEFFFVGVPGKTWAHAHPSHLYCSCTFEKVLNSMKLLGEKDLQAMIKSEESTPVQCEMCGKGYTVSTKDLKGLLEEVRGLH